MSGDCKELSIRGVNEAIRTAEKRFRNNVSNEIAGAAKIAVRNAVEIADRHIHYVQQDINEKINKVNNNLKNKIEQTQRQLGAKIDQQSRQTAQALQDLDRRHTKALRDLTDSVADAIKAQDRRITSEVNRIDRNMGVLADGLNSISRGIQELASSTNQKFRDQQQQLNSVQNDIKTIFDRQQSDTNNKLLAAGAALAILDAVRERTDVDRYAPKHLLDSIRLKEDRLRHIQSNPDSCTITDANNLIDEAIVLENEAIRNRAEWEPPHHATLTSAIAVLKMLEASEKIEVTSLHNENEVEELRADYWTHGKYGKVLAEIRRIKEEIENMPVDTRRLDELQSKINQLQRESENLLIEAAELGLLSENRVIFSNDVLNALVEQGWEFKEGDFEGGEEDCDMREGIFAIISNPGRGEELTIRVFPQEEDGKVINKTLFHRNDNIHESTGAFRSRMEAIRKEIEKSGYEIGPLEAPGYGGDGKVEILRKPEELRRKGASQKLKKALSHE